MVTNLAAAVGKRAVILHFERIDRGPDYFGFGFQVVVTVVLRQGVGSAGVAGAGGGRQGQLLARTAVQRQFQ